MASTIHIINEKDCLNNIPEKCDILICTYKMEDSIKARLEDVTIYDEVTEKEISVVLDSIHFMLRTDNERFKGG